MDIKRANSITILANMQEIWDNYKKGTKRERKGIEPYVSMCCIDKNKFYIKVIDGIEDERLPDYNNEVLITVKYPRGLPAYKAAVNYSKISLHEALWEAEGEAWNNHENFKSSPIEEIPKEFMHENKIIKEHIRLKDLGIKDLSDMSIEHLYELLINIDDKIYRSNKKVMSTVVSADIAIGKDIFWDNLGNEIIQEENRAALEMQAFAKADDMPDYRHLEIYDRVGGFGGIETFERMYKEAMIKADEIGNRVVEFAKAKDYDGNFELEKDEGNYDIVLDGSVAAVSIHEVGAGHGTEASELLKEKESKPRPFKFGRKYGINDLNIVDYGLLEIKGIKPFSWYTYDIEGVKARETYIIKNGIYNSPLHTKLTAGSIPKEKGGGMLTGNARAETAEDEPEARMSTLYIQPVKKKCSLDDLLYSIKGKGLYIRGLAFGETDRAQGKVGIKEIYFINKAGHKVPLRMKGHNLHILESVSNYMSKISAIGDESTVSVDTGWCGSESGEIPHTACGAALKVEKVCITPEELSKPLKKPLVPVPRR